MEPPPGVEPGLLPYEGRAASRARRRSYRGWNRTSVLLFQRQGGMPTTHPVSSAEGASRTRKCARRDSNPHLDGFWGRYVYRLHDSRSSPAAVTTGGAAEVAVGAHHLALIYLGLDGRPRVAAREHATYFVSFVILNMIELEDYYVGLSAVRTGMLYQIIHDVLPVLKSNSVSPASCAAYVELLVGQVVLAGVLAALFWIGVSHYRILSVYLHRS